MELFGTAGIRGSATERVTPELALAVGRAVGRDGAEFVVARDGRVTGPALAAAVEAGLLSAGAGVRRAGMLPTPALAFASRGRRGVMLTASHNPPTDNGIKVFDDGVEYDRTAERAVEERVAGDEPPTAWDQWGDSENEAVLSAYRSAVVDYARGRGAPLSGLRVAVDCGNGMAGLATPQVLRSLGAEVVTLNGNVDGHFPGRESKPTPESLRDLRTFVADAGDDGDPFAFGIGHDGDADRIVVVAPDGEVVHEDTVVAILAEHYVRSVDADDPVVVTTPNASARIDERVREAGGRVERVRLGALHEGIAAAENAGGDVVFAAEPWKHIHTQFGGWIDGVVSAAVVGRLVADAGLDALRDPVTERPYRKVSVDCPDEAKRETMATLERTLPDAFPEASVDTEYGVRLEFPDSSWLLVRPSGTEPYVRLYAESDDVDSLVADAGAVVERAVETAKN
ncbi:phosphomannomutase [Haloprofundus sp. MHR1]|uniref:phosphomannomutase n=1 Tax=Haloprofundus sp. MHR1 TaxID=2572921 RepID=UPI0010BF3F46|nr:phosphomannomutase [Haloprofundus sp. MHR1]QCJ48035.1 phosphomannomutase [Haloprofundus sp. MHR1]